MDLSGIPKVFWYTISFCMLMITIAFVILAWKSQSVSLEVAHTKIELLNTASEIQELSKTIEFKQQELKKASESLKQATTRPSILPEVQRNINNTSIPEVKKDIEDKLNNVQQKLKE